MPYTTLWTAVTLKLCIENKICFKNKETFVLETVVLALEKKTYCMYDVVLNDTFQIFTSCLCFF